MEGSITACDGSLENRGFHHSACPNCASAGVECEVGWGGAGGVGWREERGRKGEREGRGMGMGMGMGMGRGEDGTLENVSIQASSCRCLSMSADAHHRHHQHHRHHLRLDTQESGLVRALENHVSLVDKLGYGLTWVSFLLHDIQPSSAQSGCLALTTHIRAQEAQQH